MAPSVETLKGTFRQNSCPADLPVYDSGIDPTGIKMPFAKIITAVAPHTDILSLGDQDHDNPALRGVMKERENLVALKQGGFTDIGVEVSQRMQHWVTKYNDGALTRKEFEDKIDRSLSVVQGNGDGCWTRQIGTMVEFAKDNGMQFSFADPGNGSEFCDTRLSESEYNACDVKKWKERFQDNALATHLNDTVLETPKGKGLLIYGGGHLSVDNGTREAINGRVVKVDVYANREAYEGDKVGIHKDNAATGINTNQIKPDLIYFQETGVLHTTCNTSPALKTDIARTAAEIAPKPEPDASPVPPPAPAQQSKP